MLAKLRRLLPKPEAQLLVHPLRERLPPPRTFPFPSPPRLRHTPPIMVRARAVSKVYSSGSGSVHALREVSMEIAAGDFVALMGPSGCGKSTLLHMLGGLDRPNSGEIFVEDQPLHDLDDSALTRLRRTRIGVVFQFFNLLPTLTVLENVTLPALLDGRANRRSRDAALALLDEVGLVARARHLAHQLSGGEMQRAAIARALINNPALVLADEPTGNLDSESSLRVLDLLRRLSATRRATILMVTHSPEVAGYARRTLRMRDGRLVL